MPEKSYIIKGFITTKVEVFNAKSKEDAEKIGFEMVADLLNCTGYGNDFNLEMVEADE
jgi:aerobic-type carbon monoxide dehydrogenase small subunit (CoxS/CutS family)